ncbi:MAG: hypothetical protein JW841_15450 [Deltaproteobacteria bacterium]|nr:hypothetical protein [Deltaproteobacteria bacterium]
MPYTSLRLTERGIVLKDFHMRRLQAAGPNADAALEQLAKDKKPGCYSVWAEDKVWRIEPRGESRLYDGMPIRYLPSPLLGKVGPCAKTASPNPYDAVRTLGIATLLTSANGEEIFESCSAAVIGWDGNQFICVPENNPHVWSTSEAAIRKYMPFISAPIKISDTFPVILVNAIKGVCTITTTDRQDMPQKVIKQLEELFLDLTYF